MSKASVLALAQQLANRQADATNLDQLYDNLVQDVAQAVLFNRVVSTPATAGTGTYNLEAILGVSEILGLFYDDDMLSLLSLRELEATSPDWRAAQGRPVGYTREDLSHNVIRLYPVPVTASDPVIPAHGAPFGLDYPRDTIAMLGSFPRRDMPVWLDLPLALLLLAKEYARDSPHIDLAFSEACKQLGDLVMAMVA